MHVIIAGGGLSGLALAHGLIKDGHTVTVLERDNDLNARAGYYLTLNDFGGQALRRCLPDDLFALYQRASRRTPQRRASIVMTPGLQEISSQPSMALSSDPEFPDTGIHRRTLRQILSARLDGVMRLGTRALSYVEDADGVTVTCDDGSTVRGDILVAADGVRSVIRDQRLPQTRIVEAQVQGISLFGLTPITDDLAAILPDELYDGNAIIVADRTGTRCLLVAFESRENTGTLAAEHAPDVRLDDVPAYFMVSCSVPPGTEIPHRDEWTAETPARLRAAMLEAIAGWHPAVVEIVAHQDLDTIFRIPFAYVEPLDAWEPGRVTVLGDAAHAMLPTLGMGANMALNDARLLVDALAEHDDPVAAIGAYEQQMRDTAYPILLATIDHDRAFGGGGLKSQD
jgi:2-polyprenyl-6-methoxyphenol hydroxylase-like FAD-dependent oxidoreductase